MPDVRRLAIVSAGFALAVAAAHYLLPVGMLLPAAAVCAVLSLCGLFFRDLNRKRLILAFLALAVGFGAYRMHYARTVEKCEALTGDAVTVSARVTAYPDSGGDYGSIYLKFTDSRFPRLDGVVFYYDGECDGLRPGDEISITVKLRSGSSRYDSYTDVNVSKGLYLVGNVCAEPELTGRWDKSWLYFPQELGHVLRGRIKELFPPDTAHFMLALLTGDKNEYYLDDELSNAMAISGIAHVVAVSGMHVAFLVGFLQLILGKNRRSSIICIALVWVFVVMAGAPPSAVRAGVMQSLLLLAPIFRRTPDNATGLCFALALILAQNPFAIGSAGLQLSFAAMAGIYLFSKPIFERLKKYLPKNAVLSRIVFYVFSIFTSSVSVMVFSVPIIALRFGYVSLLGIIVNVLCIWAVSSAFCLGYFACLAGKLFAVICSYLVRWVALVVKYTARLPFAAVYTQNRLIAAWLILAYAMFIICYAFRGKEKFRPLVPAALSVVTLAAVMLMSGKAVERDAGTVSVLNVGSGQCITLTEGESCVVIDCGSSGIALNAGNEASDYLHSQGRSRIDCLVLTHLHKDHASGAVRLINMTDVGLILLPQTEDDPDEGLFAEVLAAAEKNAVPVGYVSKDRSVSFGGISLDLYAPSDRGDKNERCIMLTAQVNGSRILITGDANSAVERELAEREELSDTDILIVGHHGSKSSCCQELLSEARPDKAIISVGWNSYGHPTNTVLARLRAFGAEIYRTDLMGRVVIHPAA